MALKPTPRSPPLEEALLACKGKILVNIDKAGDYIQEITPILKATGTEKQVIIKGTYDVEKVKTDYGNHTGMLYMPIITLGKEKTKEQINTFLNEYKPIAFEICFKEEKDMNRQIIKEIVNKHSRVWINTLWDNLCGGHDDEMAMIDPDKNWGWILEQQASMIQTDRPQELIEYLKRKNRHQLK